MKIDADFHREYETRCDVLEDLGPVAERLIQELMRANGIELHSVRHRVKTKGSVQRKVGQKDASYEDLGDIHDLLGVRVITFFPDEVDHVATVIEAEFSVDAENSVDKRALLDPDRFGYLSLHYVVSLNDSRCRLTEHARFDEAKFEIQIRSILQHAWAEIEHDLGYHAAGAIPDSFRRRFSRLAGLLEIADDEFQTLREEIAEYQISVDEEIDKAPESVPVDQDSMAAFMRSSAMLHELDAYIAGTLGRSLIEEVSGASAGAAATRFEWTSLQTIAEVAGALRDRRPLIEQFVDLWAGERGPVRTDIYRGIGLFYLVYILVAEAQDLEKAVGYLEGRNIGDVDEDGTRRSLAEGVLNTYRAAITQIANPGNHHSGD